MKSNSLVFRKFVYLTFFAVLCCLVYSSTVGVALGQKKPGSLRQGTTSDDKVLCKPSDKGDNDESDFCGFYKIYMNENSSPEVAKKARNEMIDLVQWQIEIYYKARKDNRKKLVAMLQTIFDVLEIGTAAATGIINGTLRAKSVMAQSLSGFQAGRTAFNRNFDILQTQVLINTMNSNRAEIATSIEKSKGQSVDDYTWYEAKKDLTRLLNAGTFSDALDTLVKNTGDRAANAEKELEIVKSQPLAAPSTKQQTDNLKLALPIRNAYDAALAGTDQPKKDAATAKLRSIVAELADDDELLPLLREQKISSESTGVEIVTGLDNIIDDHLNTREGRALVDKIMLAIIKAGK